MPSKFQNRVRRILYRPSKKKRPYADFITKTLDEAEKALEDTVGGILGGRKRRRRKK
ncbi:MAG: hypothetical protein FWE21_08070 [Defluviitaleaceae bacterium]|nr:hypothetical protein [Defluviitaleaceae bacterium]